VTVAEPQRIVSRANPLLVQLRRLLHDGSAYRRHGLLWIEGEHLCAAAVARGIVPQRVLYSDSGWARPQLRGLAPADTPCALLPDALFAEHSSLESPADVGMVLAVPQTPALRPDAPTVILDRLQDAGNAGSILRSAAAFGVRQVLALKGTVALWSPKVLRAGMGAHFALALIEGCGEPELEALRVPLLATSPRGGEALHRAPLPAAAGWIFGHEGQGVSGDLAARCTALLRIEQPGGEESLNVAAAAAICLYESSRRSPAGQ
jgi:RNA methyltransferase, TrmH family